MELTVKKFGPIDEAQLDFGDLTFLIGPQASGKSLALELFKLLMDTQHIISVLRNYGYILNKKDASTILGECYFGEGMSALFTKETEVYFRGEKISLSGLLAEQSHVEEMTMPSESVFYVPAQRILGFERGRPRSFTEFGIDTPYVLRRFSDILRVFLQGGLGEPDILFPMRNRLKGAVRNAIHQSVFHKAKVVMDKTGIQRNMKLDVDGVRIPFMAWSAGQKEFMPLLLAIYCLSGPPSGVVKKDEYEWVVIEEPEMGLHPRAITAVLLEIIELMHTGKKVVVSTHASTLLEFAWVFNRIKGQPGEKFKEALCRLFGVGIDTAAANIFDDLQRKTIKTYYAGNQPDKWQSTFVDISSLDALSDDVDTSEWGELSSFSDKASEIVSIYGV